MSLDYIHKNAGPSIRTTARPSAGRTGRTATARPAATPPAAVRPDSPAAPGWPPGGPGWHRSDPRRGKRTTTEVTPRRPSPDLPIIGLEALLGLVEWIE